jgi:multisubunit Na+/H+ antiporter MnhB subunit
VCARIVLFLAVLAFLVQRSTDGILAVLVIGGAGVVACAAIGRRSRLEARERREAVDALVAAVLGPLAPRPSSKHA